MCFAIVGSISRDKVSHVCQTSITGSVKQGLKDSRTNKLSFKKLPIDLHPNRLGLNFLTNASVFHSVKRLSMYVTEVFHGTIISESNQ